MSKFNRRPNRHPGGSRDLVQSRGTSRREIPAFAGMTMMGVLLLLTACSVAQGQTGESAPAAPAAPAAAPPGPAPMPEPVTLADRPDAGAGEKLYVEKCIMCHGPNSMGTGLLGRRSDQPDLEKRDNLARNYVIFAARQGIGNMPAIPRGEVSDEEMALIAEYLAAGPHGVAP